MKKILLPTDFSANAYNAIEYAVQFFREETCKFYLLNTYTPAIFDSEYVIYNSNLSGMVEFHQQDNLFKLQKIIKKIKKEHSNKSHSFKAVASFNFLSEGIKIVVREKKIDLVIMGTKGATGASQLLFGTQTVHVFKIATFPILAIPSQYHFETPKNILLPTDFELQVTEEKLKLIKEMAGLYDSKILILHILKETTLSENQEKVKKELGTLLKEFHPSFHIIKQKDISQAIYEFQEKNSIDMLIMNNNKHSFFENLFFRPLTNKIGFHTKIPFLMIPSGTHLQKE